MATIQATKIKSIPYKSIKDGSDDKRKIPPGMFKDPRFHKGAARVRKAMWQAASHPGRTYLRVIHPVLRAWAEYPIPDFRCKAINLYGLRIKTQSCGWTQAADWSCQSSVRDFTHADLDRILSELGKKRFKSKLKHDKIAMLLKH